MPDKPYKRLKGSMLSYDAMTTENTISGNKRSHVLYPASTSSKTTGKIVPSKQEVFGVTTVIIAAVLFLTTIASFAKPVASCSVKFGLPEYERADPVSAEEEPKAKTGEIFPWKDIRLPSFIVPVHYDLFMFPNLKTFENSGSVNITFQVTTQTNFIVLHSKDLNLSRILVTEKDEREIPILQYLEYPKHEQLYVKIDGNFMPNLEYKLRIDFESSLEENMEGFYLSSYKTSDGQKRYLATTHFEPTAARSAFPCFDEPALKATFQLAMVHDKNYKAYFNSEVLQTAPYSEGLSVTSFQKTVKMSTYLVAFVVCDFRERQITNIDGINIRVLVPAEQYGESEFALEIAADVLHFYTTFFNISYPLPKLDMAAIPDFASGAMENWGLVTFRRVAVLYNPSETSTENQEIVAYIISHELAHQWFGNLVTMQWWNDLWLNEGFASFMEAVAMDNIRPDWEMMDEFVVTTTHAALSLDSLQTSHPIVTEVVDPLEIDAAFDIISYNKGAAILRMLADFLGMETLQKGLSYYLNKYRFQNARTEDLWNAFTEVDASHINVSKIMDTWTRQKGYPLITVTLEHSTVKIKQERFLITPQSNENSSSDVSPYGYKWFVPVTYVTDLTNEHNTYWLNMSDGEFVLPAEAKWLKVNVNQTGFYRVTYDNGLWKTLTDLLHSNHKIFTPTDRANLVDDALSLSRAGVLEAVLAFNVTHYLEKEEEYAPWETAILLFEQLGVLMQDSPLVLSLFQKYVVKLLKPTVSTLGWDDKGNHMERKLRSAILAASVHYGDEQTVSRAKQMFQDWVQNGSKVPPNLRSAVYNAGVKYGGKEEWEFCWKQYQETQVPSEKQLLLIALGNTQDVSQLSQYLNFSLDKDKIRPQDMFLPIVFASRNLIGRSLTWSFVRTNWPRFLEIYGEGSFAMTMILSEAISHFSTQSKYDEAKAFFSSVNVGSGKDALKQSLEVIKANIQWREEVEASVTQWLQQSVN